MMTSNDKVGGWVKNGQNHDDVILERSHRHQGKWYVSNLLTVLLRCLLAILSGYICANLPLSWDTLLSGHSFAILLWDLLTRLYGHLCTLLSGNCRTLLSLNGLTVFLWDVCANLSWYLRALLARNLKIEVRKKKGHKVLKIYFFLNSQTTCKCLKFN